VVMEICQGKSLESVGKRIKERGARVGEKVAGRLAEGVCPLRCFNVTAILTFL
jgi:mitogen-activated protein kinase kinase